MASVTFSPGVGGDGSTVTDDADPTTGLANGGHRLRFVPSLGQMVAIAQVVVADAAEAVAAAVTAINAPGTAGTSTTSTTLGLGAKSLTIQTGKAIVVGMQMIAVNTSSPATQYMRGTVTGYNTGTGVLGLSIDYFLGTGTVATWTVSLTGAMDQTRAPLNNAALTGTPTAPTAAPGTSTTQLATTEFVAIAGISTVTYANRGTLRGLSPATNAKALVESLGLFQWTSGSTEYDDDETCFATGAGCWLLVAVDPEWVAARTTGTLAKIKLLEKADIATQRQIAALQAEDLKLLRGSFAMSLTGLAATSASDFTVTITGAAVGDSVVVTPGDVYGTAAANRAALHFVARVSAADTVTVNLRNASTSSAEFSASTWTVLVIKQ